MRFNDDEFQEWHEYVYKQRNLFKRFLLDILTGVPTISGMASDYRQLKLDEIKKRARELLE